MQCVICNDFFLVDNNFSSLFSFPKICPKCLKKYDVHPKLEVIPIQDGLIYYYYLYEDIQVNRLEKLKLNRYFYKLYKMIPSKRKSVILIIDDLVYEQLKKEIHYIPRNNKIIFLSLFRYDFVDFVNFI